MIHEANLAVKGGDLNTLFHDIPRDLRNISAKEQYAIKKDEQGNTKKGIRRHEYTFTKNEADRNNFDAEALKEQGFYYDQKNSLFRKIAVEKFRPEDEVTHEEKIRVSNKPR